ncbi:MAG: neutral zinc metallopeptidase [Nocardioides sp.]|uniref:KPN_02809 family neutral zinc metallopeptidase n=1 Tax=Nocardioides sp. TaxID=35761 RepID=UPI0039E416A9
MRFNPKARLDTSRTRSGGSGRAGRGGALGSGAGIPVPGGLKAGGGLVVIVIAVVIYFLSSSGGGGGLDASTISGSSLSGGSAYDYSSCQTGEDANQHSECALVAIENSLTDYWSDQPQVTSSFEAEKGIVVFHGSVSTDGCGTATSDVGPFYCPGDSTIYLDTDFFTTVYAQLGGTDSPFVRAYVIAHEYGHHIQNLLGTMSRVKTQQGADSDSVRLELQADCYAGMWTAAAEGDGLIEDISASDISEAIAAAHTVGDDYIQNRTQGGSNPESWTHGSSAEREAWFDAGRNAGDDIDACDTFSARDLTSP